MLSAVQVQFIFLERLLSTTADYFHHSVLELSHTTTKISIDLNNQGILVHFLAEEQEFTLFQSPDQQETYPESLSVGTGGCFLGEQRPGREGDSLPSATAEVKNNWIYTPFPSLSLTGQYRNFTKYVC
jgi:hypothetical protein